jgi:ribosomal subunit interface protein
MKIPLSITFRGVDPSPAVKDAVQERADKLEKFYGDIMHCHVVVEKPHQHHHKGNLYHIRIDVTVPGNELVVQRAPEAHHAHEDPYVAIRDAFDSMRRQLEDYARIRRGKVKTHEVPAHGRVFQLDPEHDHGKLETPDGREVYFHRNSVVDTPFDKLTIGAEVRYVEELGEKGPQASSVYLIGKHHPVP